MAAHVHDDVLDGGLLVLTNSTTQFTICNAEPLTYNDATLDIGGAGGKRLGYRTASGLFASPATAGDGNGQSVTSTQFSNGTVTQTGTASWMAAVDGTRLLYTDLLTGNVAVTANGGFSLSSFYIQFRAHA